MGNNKWQAPEPVKNTKTTEKANSLFAGMNK